MKFKIHVKDANSDWWEDYDIACTDPEAYGKQIVEYYNDTLRPKDLPRTYLGYEILDELSTAEHDWQKSNLVTIAERGKFFDTYRCERCGITGKRYGLTGVERDPQFKAKVYAHCSKTQAHLEARRKRQK